MSSGSRSAAQSDAERAIAELIPIAAQYQDRLGKALRERETGHAILRVAYVKGRVTFMGWKAEDGVSVQIGRPDQQNPLDE